MNSVRVLIILGLVGLVCCWPTRVRGRIGTVVRGLPPPPLRVPALGGCAILLSPINVTLSYAIEIIQFRGNPTPLTW
jgi:hypothetical protein